MSRATLETFVLTKAVYIGTGGSVALSAVDSAQDVTFVNIVSGSLLDIRVLALRQTGTTASNIISIA